jgi:hypothetical protein
MDIDYLYVHDIMKWNYCNESVQDRDDQLDAFPYPHFTRQRTQQPCTVATLFTLCLTERSQRCLLATQRNTAYRGTRKPIHKIAPPLRASYFLQLQ